MKTFTKTLLAGGLGLFGMFGAAEAALPYGHASNSYGSTASSYGIAAGGCYVPPASSRYGSGYGGSTRPVFDGRSAHGDRYRPLPHVPAGRGTSYGGWDDDCGYDASSRLPSRSSSHRDRYDGSPLFEPWRPANASHRPDRRNW